MARFVQTEGPAQAWVQNARIPQIQVPRPTDIQGSVSYSFTDLPEGVEFNSDTFIIYGSPDRLQDGEFELTAIDNAGDATWSFQWSVVAYDPPIMWQTLEPLNVVIGQPVEYQLPEPVGGTPPFTYAISEPPGRGSVVVGERRLPAGVTFVGGLFSGTPTDTPDNRGGVWVDVTFDMGFVYQNGGRRILRQRRTPPVSGSAAPVYDGITYGDVDFVTRTRLLSSQAEAEVADGGLRINAGGLFIRTPHIQNNPYVRLTNTADGRDRKLAWAAAPGGNSRWPILTGLSPGFYTGSPNANDLYITGQGPDPTAGVTPQQVRVRIGTDTSYTLTLTATDALGSVVEQPLSVQVTQADATIPVPVLVTPVALSTVVSVNVASGVAFDGELDYTVELRGDPPASWRQSEQRANITAHQLTPGTDYTLWARNRTSAGIGRAAFIHFTTLSSGATITAPPPARLESEEQDGLVRVRCDVADIQTRAQRYEYQVVLASENIQADRWQTYQTSTGATSVFTFPGLINDTEYRIGLRAVNQAGGGSHNEIRATPRLAAGDVPPEAKIQLQVMIDLVAPGEEPLYVPWFDLANRVLACQIDVGRAAKQFVVQTGTCQLLIDTADDFINVSGSAPYRIDTLQDRQVLINEVLELPGGVMRRRTRFAGIVETAALVQDGQNSHIEVLLVDRLGLLAREEVTFTEDLPAQLTGDRIKYLLDLAGWSSTDPVNIRYYDPELIDEGSKTCAVFPIDATSPVTVNLLDELNLTAESEGGRLFISAGGDNEAGNLTFKGASPVTQIDGRIHDRQSADPGVIRVGAQPVVEAEDSVLYNDFELSYPGSEFPEVRVDQRSIEAWGRRTYQREVRTDRESTEALIRALLKQFRVPRKWISSLPVSIHFQTPSAARLLQNLDLSQSLLVEYTPTGGTDAIVGLQRVDGLNIVYSQLDRQYARVDANIRLLVPESEVYWILEELGADAFDRAQTFLAPRRNLDPPIGSQGGRLPGGWRVTTDKEFQVVSANRYDAILSQQSMPRYTSEAERDRFETNPVHGMKAEVIFTDANDVKHYYITEYDGTAFQWLRRATLTLADANPTFTTFLLADSARGLLGAANVWAEAEALTDLTK